MIHRLPPLTRLLVPATALWLSLPAAAAEVSGHVTDADDRPVVGARVEALPPLTGHAHGVRVAASEPLPEAVATATTDARGAYRLTVPSDRLLHIRVGARGYIPMQRGPEPFLDDEALPVVRLLPDRGAEVIVVDETGEPVAGARVSHQSTESSRHLWRQASRNRWQPSHVTVFTDDTGRARLPRAVEEELVVRAWAPGRVSSSLLDTGPTPTRLRLAPAAARRVEIRDRQGRPVAGALVRTALNRDAAVTDDQGRASIAWVPWEPGVDPAQSRRTRVTVRISSADGRAADAVVSAPEPDAPDAPQVLVLPDPWPIRGRVLSAVTGKPLAGALVWRAHGDDAGRRQRDALGDGLSDREGWFELAFPGDTDRLRLLAAAPGHFVDDTRLSQPTDARQRPEPVEIHLPPAARLRGRVVDPEGQPVAGAELAWASVELDRRRSPTLTPKTRSDPDGGFVAGPLEADKDLFVQAESAGYAPARLRVPAARLDRPVELVLETGTVVAGRVVGPDGEPVVARLRFHEADPGSTFASPWTFRLRTEDPRAETDSAADGHFEVFHIAPGRYTAEVEAAGYAPRGVSGFEVADERRFDLGDLALEAGLVLEGRVVDEDGRPVAGATVSLGTAALAFAPAAAARFGTTTVSGDDGTFRFEDQAAGRTDSVVARKEGYASAQLDNVRISGDEPTAPLVLVLAPGARLYGQVVDADGELVPGASLALAPAGVGLNRFAFQLPLTADAEGRFDRTDLPLGRYELRLGRFSMRPATTLETVELVAGEEVGPLRLVLPATTSVTGRVVDLDGRPVADARVSFSSETATGPMGRVANRGDRSDAGGRFRVDDLTAGAFRAAVVHPDHGREDRTVELRDGENTVDFRLRPSARIDLHVTAAETGEPIAGARAQWQLREDTSRSGAERTDAEGHAVLRPSGEGTVSVQVTADGYRARESAEIWVGERTSERMDIALEAGLVVVGRVIGLSPGELGRVALHAFSTDYRGFQQGAVDHEGSFRLEGLAPGTWQITAASMLDNRSQSTSVALAEGDAETYVELEFIDGYALTVTVRANGRPASGAGVSVVPLDGGTAGYGLTDHQGRHRFTDLQAGRYRLTVNRNQVTGEPHELDLVTDDEMVIELDEGIVRGRAVTAEGEPAPGVEIALLDPDNVHGLVLQSIAPQVTDGVGRFELAGIPTGDYRLRLRTDEGAGAVRTFSAVPPVTDLGDVVLEPTPAIVLRFRGTGTGPPLGRVTVWARDGTGTMLSRTEHPVRNGESRVAGIPNPAGELLVELEDYVPAIIRRSPGDPEIYPVTLIPGATLQLSVPSLADGRIGRVHITGPGGVPAVFRMMSSYPGFGEGYPLEAGLATIPRLDPGPWTVTATTSDGQSWTGSVDLKPGEMTELVLE